MLGGGEGAQVNQPRGHECRRAGPVPLLGTVGGELTLVAWCKRAGRLTNSAITRAKTQGSELVHPNIHPIDELQECVKGLGLQIQSLRSS